MNFYKLLVRINRTIAFDWTVIYSVLKTQYELNSVNCTDNISGNFNVVSCLRNMKSILEILFCDYVGDQIRKYHYQEDKEE